MLTQRKHYKPARAKLPYLRILIPISILLTPFEIILYTKSFEKAKQVLGTLYDPFMQASGGLFVIFILLMVIGTWKYTGSRVSSTMPFNDGIVVNPMSASEGSQPLVIPASSSAYRKYYYNLVWACLLGVFGSAVLPFILSYLTLAELWQARTYPLLWLCLLLPFSMLWLAGIYLVKTIQQWKKALKEKGKELHLTKDGLLMSIVLLTNECSHNNYKEKNVIFFLSWEDITSWVVEPYRNNGHVQGEPAHYRIKQKDGDDFIIYRKYFSDEKSIIDYANRHLNIPIWIRDDKLNQALGLIN